MSPYLQTILRDLGLLLHTPGLMALVSLPICLVFGEYYAIPAFLWTASISLAIGQLLYRLCRQGQNSSMRHALITVALSWGLIPLLGAIPFWSIASYLAQSPPISLTLSNFQNPWNAVFESFSGFTSTGLTMTLHPPQLPHILQWWRSFTEWIGGVGVIVLMVSVLEPTSDAYQLYSAEGRQKRIGLTVKDTVRKIWKVYLLYTAISILWLRLVGMPWWDAINHAFTGISTGGFAITENSIGSYSPLIQLAVIPIMTAGAISFSTHYLFLRKRRLSELWKDNQHQALWILLFIGPLLLLFETYWFKGRFHFLDNVFQWVSALGTCGFSSTDLKGWSAPELLLLTIGMFFGAASGSTVGGLKLTRVTALYKAILWRFQRITLEPHQMMRFKMNGEVITETEANRRVESAAVLAVLWIIWIGIGVFVLLNVVDAKYNLSHVIFESASALGSVGLSTGITSPTLAWPGKLVLILLMWMGRLEIIPVLLLLSWPLGRLGKIIGRQMRRK